MQDDPVRMLRHDIYGRLNALTLCIAALGTSPSQQDADEFLRDIINAAAELDDFMVQWDAILEEGGPPPSPPSPAG